ncbi:MAG: hypothetical protein CMP59_10555 [Flavobacteriales bacterium]|nr:hypothetical protein [Flavobacteriales bacterium]
MTIIDTEKKLSKNAINKLFDFLFNMNNFEKLMPSDKIEKWESSEDQCEFTIKGMARIGLKREESQNPDWIKLSSFGKVPFNFNLKINLEEVSADETNAQIHFEGDINPFMKMMVEKPLKNFFNMLVDKAAELKL